MKKRAASQISPPHREKSGKRQRLTRTQIEQAQKELEERKRAEIMGTVLNQPHRMGDPDQRLHSALGQICKRLKLRDELYLAGEAYGDLTRRWRLAIACLNVCGHKSGGSTGNEVTREAADRLTDQLKAAEAGIKANGTYPYVRHICVDFPEERGLDFPADGYERLVDGLLTLAVHFRMIPRFRG